MNSFSLGQKVYWLDITETTKTANTGKVAKITKNGSDFNYTLRDATEEIVVKSEADLSDLEGTVIDALNYED